MIRHDLTPEQRSGYVGVRMPMLRQIVAALSASELAAALASAGALGVAPATPPQPCQFTAGVGGTIWEAVRMTRRSIGNRVESVARIDGHEVGRMNLSAAWDHDGAGTCLTLACDGAVRRAHGEQEAPTTTPVLVLSHGTGRRRSRRRPPVLTVVRGARSS